MSEHRYYLINRPPSIGTHPADEIGRKTWLPRKPIEDTEWYAYGYVEYRRPLDFEQVWRYELRPADENELSRYYDWRNEEGK